MGYADDIIANAQGWGARQQQAYDGAKASGDAAYDRMQTQAGQRADARGDYAGAIVSLANVPGSLQAITGLQDRSAGVASQLMALQGDRQGAMARAAQTGDPKAVQDAGVTAGSEQAYHLGFLMRAAHMIGQIPAQPGDAQGDPNTPRARAVASLSQHLTSAGLPGDLVSRMTTAPKDDASLGQFVQGLTPLHNGTVKNADGSTAEVVNGVTVAEGRSAPLVLKRGVDSAETAVDPRTSAVIGQTQPVPRPLEFTKTGPAETPGVFNPNQGPSVEAPAAAPTGGSSNNPGNVHAPPQGAWAGQTGVNPNGTVSFSDPQSGLRALDLNLQAYARHGITTPEALVSRWASTSPPNEQAAYVQRIRAAVGNQFDLSDPRVRAAVTPAIIASEGTGGGGAPGGGGSHYQALGAPRLTTIGADGLQHAPDGSTTDPLGRAFGVQNATAVRDSALKAEGYTQAEAALAALKAMHSNAATLSGPSAYSVLDTFARAINPGAVARPQVIETIERSLGPLNGVEGGWDRAFGQGNLTPKVRQQIIDAVTPFAQAHWDQADALNKATVGLINHASKGAIRGEDYALPLEGRPSHGVIAETAPPLAQRRAGQLYLTPRGPMTWTGAAWRPAT